MTDFIAAIGAGLAQTVVGHPFDTVKVLIQNKQSIKNLKPRDYYRGYKYPLISSVLINSIIFPVYERTKPITKNAFLSGFLGGMTITPINFLFDYGKINNQTNLKKKIIYENMIKSYGKLSVFLRESIGFSIYFGVYDYLKKYKLHPLISGALCGVANWTTTYPIDVIKSRQISKQISFMEALKLGKIWAGFHICILRAMIVNASIFATYETILNFLS